MTETATHLPFPLHGVRPFRPEDREQVLALAPRLTEGVAPWRDPARVANAPARKLYAALGFLDEEVRLTKAVRPGPAKAAAR